LKKKGGKTGHGFRGRGGKIGQREGGRGQCSYLNERRDIRFSKSITGTNSDRRELGGGINGLLPRPTSVKREVESD